MHKRNPITIPIAIALVFIAAPAFSQALEDESEEIIENKLKGPIAPALEKKLPVRPVDLRDRNKTTDEQVEELFKQTKPKDLKLSGELEKGGIVSSAELLSYSPLSRYKGDNLKFFKITVANNTEKPMLILGAQSSFSKEAAGQARAPDKSIDASTLEGHDNNLLTPGKKAIIGAATVATWGMATPLTIEYLTPSENRKRNLGIALGRDRGRHEVEGERFGLRLVMPGDNTIGWAAFEEDCLRPGNDRIYVPVMYPPYSRISEVLAIPVRK